MMEKNLVQIGNSWGVIIPKPILEMMKINPTIDKIEIEIEKGILKIQKIKA